MNCFWDKVARLYDLAEISNKGVNDMMADCVTAEVPDGATVLDCAAGTGMLSLAAAKKAGRVLCTDYSPEMLKAAKKKAWKADVHNINYARRDILRLKDADNSYDIAIAGNVMHLLDEPQKAFSELVRVTKKGGKIIIPTYLLAEVGMFELLVMVYKRFGFEPKTAFDIDSYLVFIADNAEACGCKEYSTRYLPGRMPAGFAVITK